MQSVTLPSIVNPMPDSSATIDPKWLPWLRVGWALIVLDAVLIFVLMVNWTRVFADAPPARIAEGLRELGWSQDTYFWFHAALMTLTFACFLVVGCFLFFARPNDRMALFASIFLIAFGAESAYPFSPEFAASWQQADLLFRVSYFINNLFAWSFIAAFFALFPDGRFVPQWSRYVAAYVFVFSFFFGLFPSTFGAPEGWILVWVLVSACIIFGGSLYAQIWRYRHYATPIQKQQTKWLIYALALFLILFAGFVPAIYLIFPATQVTAGTSVAFDLLYFASNLIIVLVPLSIGIAVVRYRLWDIDVIIRKTLTYALVAALLAIVYFGSIILLQRILTFLTGPQTEIVTVISTLAIAALFVPLRDKIQALVDQRFYRKKYDAQQVLADFANTVRDETDLEKLIAGLVQVVNETMQPTVVSVWLRTDAEK